jgi:hypothetical protein
MPNPVLAGYCFLPVTGWAGYQKSFKIKTPWF